MALPSVTPPENKKSPQQAAGIFSKQMFLFLVALMAFTGPLYFFATRRFGFWKSLLKSTLFFVILCFIAGIGVITAQTLMAHLR